MDAADRALQLWQHNNGICDAVTCPHCSEFAKAVAAAKKSAAPYVKATEPASPGWYDPNGAKMLGRARF